MIKKSIRPERIHEFFHEANWYHTINLGDGMITNGTYDLRPFVSSMRFPASLTGKTVLDVGASDGFFSFEFERRGAKSVQAIDTNAYDGTLPIDPSPSKIDNYSKKYAGALKEYEKFRDIFSLLELKGSNKLVVLADYFNSIVTFRNHSIYNLSDFGCTYDFVYCGALLEHLKHPLKALEQLSAITGELCIITLSSALPISKTTMESMKMRLALFGLKILGLEDEFSINHQHQVLRYVGNKGGGAFFYVHPETCKNMALSSGFKECKIVGEFEMINQKNQNRVHNVILHCRK